MSCVICRCSQFTRKIMNALNIDELEKASPDASDIDLSFDEIARLQRVDKLNTKLVNMLRRAQEFIDDSGTFTISEDIDDLLAEAKEVNDA